MLEKRCKLQLVGAAVVLFLAHLFDFVVENLHGFLIRHPLAESFVTHHAVLASVATQNLEDIRRCWWPIVIVATLKGNAVRVDSWLNDLVPSAPAQGLWDFSPFLHVRGFKY